VTPILPISTAYDRRRLENTQLIYSDKNICNKVAGKIFEKHNL